MYPSLRRLIVSCFVNCLRLGSNPEIAKRVNADEVTKVEAMKIGQIFAYIKQEDAKINSHSDTSVKNKASPSHFLSLTSGRKLFSTV